MTNTEIREKREREFDERLKENGELIRQLHASVMQYCAQVGISSKSRHQITRKGNIIHFVPSYAVKGGN